MMSSPELIRSKLDWLKGKIDYLVDAIRTATPPTLCVPGSSGDSEDIMSAEAAKKLGGLVNKFGMDFVNADWQSPTMWGFESAVLAVSIHDGEKELSTGHTLASEFFSMSDDEFSFASTVISRIGGR